MKNYIVFVEANDKKFKVPVKANDENEAKARALYRLAWTNDWRILLNPKVEIQEKTS